MFFLLNFTCKIIRRATVHANQMTWCMHISLYFLSFSSSFVLCFHTFHTWIVAPLITYLMHCNRNFSSCFCMWADVRALDPLGGCLRMILSCHVFILFLNYIFLISSVNKTISIRHIYIHELERNKVMWNECGTHTLENAQIKNLYILQTYPQSTTTITETTTTMMMWYCTVVASITAVIIGRKCMCVCL